MSARHFSRRQFACHLAAGVPAWLALAGCEALPPAARRARLSVRHRTPGASTWSESAAAAADLGDGVAVSVPAITTRSPLPLIVLLHGAGGRGQQFLTRMMSAAGTLPAVVIAPNSAGATWDVLSRASTSLIDVLEGAGQPGGFGPDVVTLDRILGQVFEHVAVDRTRIAIGGFSDGATYALALGLANGDLFSRVLALSPGFVPETDVTGKPAVFVAHGGTDRIFPIDRCGRRVAQGLRARGYDVRVREFDGGHEIDESVAREALAWCST